MNQGGLKILCIWIYMTQTSRCVFSHCSSLFLQRFFWRLPCPKASRWTEAMLAKTKTLSKKGTPVGWATCFPGDFFFKDVLPLGFTLPETNSSLPLKINGWKMHLLLGWLRNSGVELLVSGSVFFRNMFFKNNFSSHENLVAARPKNLLPWSLGGWMSNLGHL